MMVIDGGHQHLVELAKTELEVPAPPDHWDCHQARLWQNAVVMAYHQHCCGDLCSFKKLLRQVVGNERDWPLDHPCNKDFFKEHDCPQLEKPWTHCLEPLVRNALTVRFLEPLEVLNTGNAFATCLRLGGEETDKLLGWATNVDVRVIAVVDEEERILGRQTIGLYVDKGRVGVVQTKAYPPDDHQLKRAIDDFRETFLRQANLQPVFDKCIKLADPCATGYNKDWLMQCPDD